MKILSIFILMITVTGASYEKEIRGIILDASTNQGLPYASVKLSNTSFGTVSNLDGEFILNISNFPAKIVVSYVGYKEKTITLEEGDASRAIEIRLEEKGIILPAVAVYASDEFAIELVRKIYERITENENDHIYGKAFYRDYLTVDSQVSEVIEMFLDAELNSRGIMKSAIDQGRFAQLKRAKDDTVVPFYLSNMSFFSIGTFKLNEHKDPFFSFLPFVKKAFAYIPIRPNAEEYYYLKTDSSFNSDDKKKVAIISFTPKPDLDRPAFSGTMEIDVSNFQVIRIDEKLDDNRFNLWGGVSANGYYVTPQVLTFDGRFEKAANGNYYLSQLRTSLKFQELSHNNPSFKRDYSFVSFLTFYDYSDKTSVAELENPNQEWDINKVMHAGYNPSFWKKHEDVIGEIPMEKNIEESFIRHGFYGNLFPGGEPLAQDEK